jgi:HEAT repeat protein
VGKQQERAEILGEMVNGHPELVEQVLPELEMILRDPEDPYALTAAIIALGHAWDPRAAALLVDLVSPRHPESDVRLELARALPGGADTEPLRSRAVVVLTGLTADKNDDVRDWACFGLGALAADGASVREALVARLDDDHVDTRCEALLALAMTGDVRALAAVIAQLDRPDPGDIRMLELRAAAELADPRLLPSLQRLDLAWAGDDPDDHARALAYALQRCQSDQGQRATALEQALQQEVNEQLHRAGSQRSIKLTGRYPRTVLTLSDVDGTPDQSFGSHRLWDDLTPDAGDLDRESWVLTVLDHEQLRRPPDVLGFE